MSKMLKIEFIDAFSEWHVVACLCQRLHDNTIFTLLGKTFYQSFLIYGQNFFSFVPNWFMWHNLKSRHIYFYWWMYFCRLEISVVQWPVGLGWAYSSQTVILQYRGFLPYATFGTWMKVALAKNCIRKMTESTKLIVHKNCIRQTFNNGFEKPH